VYLLCAHAQIVNRTYCKHRRYACSALRVDCDFPSESFNMWDKRTDRHSPFMSLPCLAKK